MCCSAWAASDPGIVTVWWVLHVIGAEDRPTLWGLYAECSTMGTILILSSTS